jgi:hypothetical protein
MQVRSYTRLVGEQVTWVWIGQVRLVTRLAKGKILGCMGQFDNRIFCLTDRSQ